MTASSTAGTEACDDGNTAPGDGCDAVCVVEFCGDGIVNNGTEVCDDGINDGTLGQLRAGLLGCHPLGLSVPRASLAAECVRQLTQCDLQADVGE